MTKRPSLKGKGRDILTPTDVRNTAIVEEGNKGITIEKAKRATYNMEFSALEALDELHQKVRSTPRARGFSNSQIVCRLIKKAHRDLADKPGHEVVAFLNG